MADKDFVNTFAALYKKASPLFDELDRYNRATLCRFLASALECCISKGITGRPSNAEDKILERFRGLLNDYFYLVKLDMEDCKSTLQENYADSVGWLLKNYSEEGKYDIS